jgi:hypothetical protein
MKLHLTRWYIRLPLAALMLYAGITEIAWGWNR